MVLGNEVVFGNSGNYKYKRVEAQDLVHEINLDNDRKLASKHACGMGAFETFFCLLEQQVGQDVYKKLFGLFNKYEDVFESFIEISTANTYLESLGVFERISYEELFDKVEELKNAISEAELLKSAFDKFSDGFYRTEFVRDYINACLKAGQYKDEKRYNSDGTAKFFMAILEQQYLLQTIDVSKELVGELRMLKDNDFCGDLSDRAYNWREYLEYFKSISTDIIYTANPLFSEESAYSDFYTHVAIRLESAGYGAKEIISDGDLIDTGVEKYGIQKKEAETLKEKILYLKEKFMGRVTTANGHTISPFENIAGNVSSLTNIRKQISESGDGENLEPNV